MGVNVYRGSVAELKPIGPFKQEWLFQFELAGGHGKNRSGSATLLELVLFEPSVSSDVLRALGQNFVR
jgi:hypothetical protein